MLFLNKLQIRLSFIYLEYSHILGPTKWFQNQIQLKQTGKKHTPKQITNYNKGPEFILWLCLISTLLHYFRT